MISFFNSKNKFQNPLRVDVHSHLLAGLDDGVKTHDEAIELIKHFAALGYKKLITTPHIMSDYYRNEPDQIKNKLSELNKNLLQQNILISVEAAAEYFLDEELMRKVESKESLLTFGKKYLLFETNFLTEPYHLNNFIFKATTQGYKPILAHPERYGYMTMERAEELRDRGVLFQINIPSLVGFYSKPIQKFADKLIDKGWVEMLGSDCHSMIYMQTLKEAIQSKYFRKAVALPLINYSL